MPISILPQDHDGQEFYNAISSFFSDFKVGNLLRKCNAQKEKGVPVLDIFKYKLCAIFQPTEEQLQLFIDMFVGRLPEYIRNSLAKAALAS